MLTGKTYLNIKQHSHIANYNKGTNLVAISVVSGLIAEVHYILTFSLFVPPHEKWNKAENKAGWPRHFSLMI